jgi:hypothetical protein
MDIKLKKRGGFARIKAQIGNRFTKPRNSIEYGWQTLESMITYWKYVDDFEDRWFEICQEVFELKLWEKLPPDKPYGSPKIMFEEELGMDFDEILQCIEREDYKDFIKNQSENVIESQLTTTIEECNTKQNVTFLQYDVERKLNILKQSADISDWGYGRWAYEKWQEFNEKYWECKLNPGAIFWGLTPHGHDFGYYEFSRNAITLHSSLLRPKSNAWRMVGLLGERFAEDVLLHVMLHQANMQIQMKDDRESHNCQSWCEEINRLVPLLGINTRGLIAAPVRQRRVDGKVTWKPRPGFMSRKEISGFPHSLRPKEYYEQETWELLEQIKK